MPQNIKISYPPTTTLISKKNTQTFTNSFIPLITFGHKINPNEIPKLLSIFFALSLISCQKAQPEEEPDENAPVIAMLEVRSHSLIPKDVIKVRLTELLKDTYVEMIPEANRPDTTKAVLSISYKKVPKVFNALVSVYHKNGKVVETEVQNIQLKEGMIYTYTIDMFKAGFTIGYNDVWTDTVVVRF